MTTPRYTRVQLFQNRTFMTVRRPGVLNEIVDDADINLFNVVGPVAVAALFGIITVAMAGAAEPQLRFIEPDAGAPVAMSGAMAATGLDGLTVNTILGWPGTIGGLLVDGASVGLFAADESAWAGYIYMTDGIINLLETNSVAATGTIDWYVSYLPLLPAGIITPA